MLDDAFKLIQSLSEEQIESRAETQQAHVEKEKAERESTCFDTSAEWS